MAIFRRTPPPSSPPGTQQPGPPKPAGPAAHPNETNRAAPEPLAIVLPAIAALGAITSIAAVAYLAEDRTADRPRVKRRIDVILKDLETSCLGTAEILRRVIRNSPMFGLLGTASTPMRFGIVGARVDAQQSQMFIHLVNDVATMLVLATQARRRDYPARRPVRPLRRSPAETQHATRSARQHQNPSRRRACARRIHQRADPRTQNAEAGGAERLRRVRPK